MTIREMTQDFASPDDRLATGHLLVSFGLFGLSMVLGTLGWGNPALVALAVLLFFGASVRLFGVQHDCGHLSYFTDKRVNVVVGVLLGAFTHNAYFAMRYNHNRHHAHIGNLDRMESHEVLTWTVAQYAAAGFWGRLYYRIYRSAPVIFVIGPLFIIFIRYRFPKNARKTGLWDVAVQNLLMLAVWGAVWQLGGVAAMKFYGLALAISACLGVFIVYVGHNHEDTYWQSDASCDFEAASLKGASVLDLGPVFDFMTFNFAYHDIHHLNARVPAYRLKACHEAVSPFISPTRLGLFQALACIRWKLWDEERGRMVTFRDAARAAPVLQPAE